jgi:hypothetical protein
MRKVLLVTIAIMLAFAVPVMAASAPAAVKRTQTVYTVLDWNGKPVEESVVNWLRVEGTGEMIVQDKPEISDVISLDPGMKPEIAGGNVTWKFSSNGQKDIFYTGKTDKPLPISFDIELLLDDKKIKPEQAIGKNGKITLSMSFTNKLPKIVDLSWKEGDKTVTKEKTLYQPMTVMVQAEIPVDSYSSLEAKDAMSMTIGSRKRIIWTLLPSPDGKAVLEYSSDSVTLPSVQISILPRIPDISIPSIDPAIQDLLASVADNTDLLDMAGVEINLDPDKILSQLVSLQSLLDASKQAIDDSKKQVSDLTKSFSDLEKGLKELASGADNLSQLSKGHKQVVETMKQGLDSNTSGLTESISVLQNSANSANKSSRELFVSKTTLDDTLSSVSKLKSQTSDKDLLDKLSDIEASLKIVGQKIDSAKQESDKASQNLKVLVDGGTIGGKDIPSISSMPESLKLLDQTLTALISGGEVMSVQMPGINTTIDGLNAISSGLNTIIKGGDVGGTKTPPLSEIPALITKNLSQFDVLVSGGTFHGVKVPSQKEILSMIDDFKKMAEDFGPQSDRLLELGKKLQQAIERNGGKEKVQKAMDESKQLLFGGQAELDKMREMEQNYKSFVGETPGAESSVLFVAKLDEVTIEKAKENNVKTQNTTPFYDDMNKYKYYILIAAIAIIIASIFINMAYKRKHKEQS